MTSLEIPRGRSDIDKAIDELKKPQDVGHIMITSVLTFDDMVEQFKMERY